MKILVTGANGQLGSEIKMISENYKYNWCFYDRNKFDLFDLGSISQKLDLINPDIIINCAAYTNVDEAEINHDYANIVNHKAIQIIANWTNSNNCRLIHISTDYIFNGHFNSPLNEDSLPKPINVYGKTKLLGDIACLKNNPDSIIIRTSWLYSSFGDNFVKKIINIGRDNKQINVINDQFGSPTYAADIAEVILKIINEGLWISGVYNYSNDGVISWFKFAKDIIDIYPLNLIIKGVSSEKYSSLAERPKYSVLDKKKIINVFNLTLFPYRDSLKRCIKILKNEI